jgi:SAM domain (Sterile alpha motif)
MDLGGWLRSLGLDRYEAAFRANAIDADVLCDLTDQDLEKLGVLLGHRRKILRAIAAIQETLAPATVPIQQCFHRSTRARHQESSPTGEVLAIPQPDAAFTGRRKLVPATTSPSRRFRPDDCGDTQGRAGVD